MGNGGQAIKAILTALALLAPSALRAETACSRDVVQLRGEWGQAEFRVDVADDDETRARGLMFVDSMPEDTGMLFVYPRPGHVRFWMKNTFISLDMLFADKTGVVRYIQHEAEPESERLIYGGNNIQYVLEINGGLARHMGIGKGTELRHPSIDPGQAAWACPAD